MTAPNGTPSLRESFRKASDQVREMRTTAGREALMEVERLAAAAGRHARSGTMATVVAAAVVGYFAGLGHGLHREIAGAEEMRWQSEMRSLDEILGVPGFEWDDLDAAGEPGLAPEPATPAPQCVVPQSRPSPEPAPLFEIDPRDRMLRRTLGAVDATPSAPTDPPSRRQGGRSLG
jgi:hypothetical protein